MLLWLHTHTQGERESEQLEAVNSSGCGCTNTTNFHLPFAVVSRLQFRHTRTRWMWSFRHVHTKNRAHEVVLSHFCHLNFLVFSFIFVNVATVIQYMYCCFALFFIFSLVFGCHARKLCADSARKDLAWFVGPFWFRGANGRTNHVRRQRCKRSDIVPISRLIHNYQKLAKYDVARSEAFHVFCVLKLTQNYERMGDQNVEHEFTYENSCTRIHLQCIGATTLINILIFAPLFSVGAVATGDATPINCQIFSVADGAESTAGYLQCASRSQYKKRRTQHKYRQPKRAKKIK